MISGFPAAGNKLPLVPERDADLQDSPDPKKHVVRRFFYHSTFIFLCLSHTTQGTHTHTHSQGKTPQALPRGFLLGHTRCYIVAAALTAYFFHYLNAGIYTG